MYRGTQYMTETHLTRAIPNITTTIDLLLRMVEDNTSRCILLLCIGDTLPKYDKTLSQRECIDTYLLATKTEEAQIVINLDLWTTNSIVSSFLFTLSLADYATPDFVYDMIHRLLEIKECMDKSSFGNKIDF